MMSGRTPKNGSTGRSWAKALFPLLFLLALFTDPQAAAQESTGWVCGVVLAEGIAFVAQAEVSLYPAGAPATEPGAKSEPVARTTSDEHGNFCLQDLSPGFYELKVSREGWHPQPSRPVEIRAGLMNRLDAIELEREPGEPRVSYRESFDGMPASEGRAWTERLLERGDAASLQELARRLLPKRGVMVDITPITVGLDPKPLLAELLRQLDRGYLPPMKTARFVYVLGEISDPRTREVVVPVFLRKLRDGRTVPPSPTDTLAGPDSTLYVSDFALHALTRIAGKDFHWVYGKSPLQNQKAINNAQEWWRNEVVKAGEKKRQ